MKNTIKQIKNLFTASPQHNTPETEERTIDLNREEKAFVNLQTHRLLLRKKARRFRLDPRPDNWVSSLPLTAAYASSYGRKMG